MTDWTDEKYVEVFVKLMGITDHPDSSLHCVLWPGGKVRTKRSINPVHDWNQCMMLVEKTSEKYEVSLVKEDGEWSFSIWGSVNNASVWMHIDKSPQRAIIRACDLAMEVEW